MKSGILKTIGKHTCSATFDKFSLHPLPSLTVNFTKNIRYAFKIISSIYNMFYMIVRVSNVAHVCTIQTCTHEFDVYTGFATLALKEGMLDMNATSLTLKQYFAE